ncbi:HAD family hydrolase [Natronorubrum sp. FCH18a]|uniref:HAD family hydrolase n=1 Tax=Natronorubrum sp. FCH18a TaxID=3447018 RepID=UPI003F51691A
MAFDPDQVETVLVDSYSTLVDELSTQHAFEPYTDKPEEAARLWDHRSTMYGLVGTNFEEFPTCREKYEHALDYTVRTLDMDITPEEQEELLGEIDQMEVYGDVSESIEELVSAGYEVYVLSNGDPDMLDHLVEHANIEDLVSDAISASEVGLYKPDRRLYRHAASKADAGVAEIAHVTCAWHDVLGAMRTGMQGVWLNRSDAVWETILGEPDLEVDSFPEFVELVA